MNQVRLKLYPLTTPWRKTIVYHRENFQLVTNCPRSVVLESPAGFDVGHGGSGPADFALNILNAWVPPGYEGESPVECEQGTCSEFAHRLHERFKREMLTRLPRSEGCIAKPYLYEWLLAAMESVDSDSPLLRSLKEEWPGLYHELKSDYQLWIRPLSRRA